MKFIASRLSAGLAPGTIGNYEKKLRYFAEFAAGSAENDLSKLFYEYARHLHATKTRNNALSIIRQLLVFFNWLKARGAAIDVSEIKCPQVRGGIKSVEPEYIVRALAVANPKNDTRFYISFMLDTALRLSEAAEIRKRDIMDNGTLSIAVRGKGDKIRVVGMGEWIERELRTRIASLGPDDKIFSTKKGAYQNRLKRIAKRLGVGFSPHRMRHSFSRFFFNNKSDVSKLQEILGHATAHMSFHYSRFYSGAVPKAQREASPVDALMAARPAEDHRLMVTV
jgi:integrase